MKHRFDKTRVAYSSAYLSATAVMLEVSVWLGPLTKTSEAWRYFQQLTYIITIVLGILTLNSLKKLIPKTLRRAILDRFVYALRKVASGVSKVSRRILRIFGIKFENYKRPKDEKSFIFDVEDIGIFKRLQSIKGSVKWRDLTENADKIRFIYIKYMIKLIKGGYKPAPCLTPNETKEELDIPDDAPDGELFRLYNGARYSGGSYIISDKNVEDALLLVNGKKK